MRRIAQTSVRPLITALVSNWLAAAAASPTHRAGKAKLKFSRKTLYCYESPRCAPRVQGILHEIMDASA
jgi:hypothetical protein